MESWVSARKNKSFKEFLPHLKEVFRLTREVAECRGYQEHPYDAVLDEYEPGFTTARLEPLFSGLVEGLTPLIAAIAAQSRSRPALLQQRFCVEKQREFASYLLAQIGFSFERGRLDRSTHPFCSAQTSSDVRLTDRFAEDQLTMSIFGALHEGGHGLYEQGCPPEWSNTPLGGGVSLGVHESQSRLWENFVGRSLPFWKAYFPRLRELYPLELSGYSAEDFQRAVNWVEPSFIRVEADEVTYTQHIVLRYQLERDIFSGKLEVADVPEAWNQKMESFLGLRPSDDACGCLQDIHWADGLIGYFPTYSLGNLIAAQLWEAVQRDRPQLHEEIAAGQCGPLLRWLQEKIYQHASSIEPTRLIELSTGAPLDHRPFLDYLWGKYSGLYGISRP